MVWYENGECFEVSAIVENLLFAFVISTYLKAINFLQSLQNMKVFKKYLFFHIKQNLGTYALCKQVKNLHLIK